MAVFEATIKSQLNGQDCVNVIHFEKPNANQSDMGALAEQIKGRFIGQAVLLQSGFVNWYMVEVRHIAVNPWPPIKVTTNQSGARGAELSFGPMTAVFKKKTAFTGPRNRGRLFLSGCGAGRIGNNGLWSAAMLIDLNSVAGSWTQWFITNGGQSGFKMILHPRDVVGPVGVDVIQIEPRSYPGVQVRRNLFRGV